MSTERWRYLGVSVTGTSHQRRGQGCQDRFVIQPSTTGELIIGVADGAGSAQHAAKGAQLVVTSAVTAVSTQLAKYQPASPKAWRDLIYHAFSTAQQTVFTHVSATETTLRDYSATLVLLVLTAEGAACGLIGDCAAVVEDEEGQLVNLCPLQRGELANQTNFVARPKGLQNLDIRLYTTAVRHAALFSDGLASLALNVAENRPFAPFFTPLFAFADETTDQAQATADLAAFLDTERVNARTHDDKTLVLVTHLADPRAR
ncbi:MAG: PP2C family serine/threonine-protein phosphatase [Caldilineaceae bacterium]